MAIWSLSLFASIALAHAGVRSINIDGTTYPAFDSRIDHLLGTVRRIEWSHDVKSVTWNPITNYSSPDLACRENSKPPLLKAPTRAGAEVFVKWTEITRMHNGPVLAYLGYLPTPTTPPQQVKFFKIFEVGFDPVLDRWGNQIASDHADSYTIRLPSDIKSGTYILRTELIALHGNMKELKNTALAGEVQIYPYCFNLEIVGSGTATPEGVTFPGAYKATDPGVTFQPFFTYGNSTAGATEWNSKYIAPGPPKYNGKYEPATGPRIPVKETGKYSPELNVKYQDMIRKIERTGLKLATYVNTAWPGYQADEAVMGRYGKIAAEGIAEGRQVKKGLEPDIAAFKAATN